MGDNTETYTDFIAEYFVKTEIGQIRKKYWKPPKIQIYPSSDGVLGCLVNVDIVLWIIIKTWNT